jgi:hypothetical protein
MEEELRLWCTNMRDYDNLSKMEVIALLVRVLQYIIEFWD